MSGLRVTITHSEAFQASHRLAHQPLDHPCGGDAHEHLWLLGITFTGLVRPVQPGGTTRPVVMGGPDPKILKEMGLEPPVLSSVLEADRAADEAALNAAGFRPDVGQILPPGRLEAEMRMVCQALSERPLEDSIKEYPTPENISLYLWNHFNVWGHGFLDSQGRGPQLQRVTLAVGKQDVASVERIDF